MSIEPAIDPRRDVGGFVRVYRRVARHAVFRSKLHAHIFIDLILEASWQRRLVRFNDREVQLERGQLVIGERRLAEDFEISRIVVRRLFDDLERAHMIARRKDHGGTVVTICNYDEYQPLSDSQSPPSSPAEIPGRAHAEPTLSPPLNKGKESKEGEEEDSGNLKISAELDFGGIPRAMDLAKVVFDTGLALLRSAGIKDGQARAMVGKWRKTYQDAEVITAIAQAAQQNISDPIPWINRALEQRGGRGGSRSGPGFRPDYDQYQASVDRLRAKLRIVSEGVNDGKAA